VDFERVILSERTILTLILFGLSVFVKYLMLSPTGSDRHRQTMTLLVHSWSYKSWQCRGVDRRRREGGREIRFSTAKT